MPDTPEWTRELVDKLVAEMDITGFSFDYMIKVLHVPESMLRDYMDNREPGADEWDDEPPQWKDEPKPKPNGPYKNGHADVPNLIIPYAIRPEAEIQRRQWIIPNLLLRCHLTLIFAAGGIGKSNLGLVLAEHVALGKAYGDFKPGKRFKVAFLSVEEDGEEIDRRTAAIAGHFKIEPIDCDGYLFKINLPDPGRLAAVDRYGKTVTATALAKALQRDITKLGIDLIIVDPFIEVWDGDENSNPQMKAAAAVLRDIARDTRCAVLLMHHIRKGEATPGDIDAGRGGGSLGALSRFAMTMTRMKPQDADALGISGQHANKVRLDSGKASYLPSVDRALWFQFVTYTLDNAGDGEPADTVGVLVPWEPPSMFAGISDDRIHRTLDAIRDGASDSKGNPVRWSAKPNAGNNSVLHVMAEFLGCEEARGKLIMKAWLKSGLCYEKTYVNADSKERIGLWVDEEKRPEIGHL
jgi:hypothetical protein